MAGALDRFQIADDRLPAGRELVGRDGLLVGHQRFKPTGPFPNERLKILPTAFELTESWVPRCFLWNTDVSPSDLTRVL